MAADHSPGIVLAVWQHLKTLDSIGANGASEDDYVGESLVQLHLL